MDSEMAASHEAESQSTVWGVRGAGGCAASCPRPWALGPAAWIQSWLSSSVPLSKRFCFAESQLSSGHSNGPYLVWLVK